MTTVLDSFIVLEGLDGAGTTTQLRLLGAAIEARGRPVHLTSEPTDGAIGREIRRILRREALVHPLTLALLYAADRSEHLHDPENGILAHLARGQTVVSDRYLFSSLAYQSLENDFEHVLALNSRFPLPRHLVYVDTPVEVSQSRLRVRGSEELFDAQRLQGTIRANYERAFALCQGSGVALLRADGTRPPEELCRDICDFLLP